MKDTAQMDIKKYWQLIVRRKYLFIAVSLLVLSVIVWGSFFMPRIYEAKSTVFIEKNIIQNLVSGIVVSPSVEDRIRVLTYSMMSRHMLLNVISAMDLDVKTKNQEETESIIKNFQNNTKIAVKGIDLFIVSYRGRSPKLARDYVNTLVSEYIEENTSSKRKETYVANRFLSDQINFYKKKLQEAEEKLMAFRREKGIYLVTDERALVLSIKKNQEDIEKAVMDIKTLEAKKAKIRQQLSGEEPFTLAVIDIEKGSGSLSARLKVLEQKIPILLTRYTENYPEVIKTRAEIETIKKQIEEHEQMQAVVQVQDSEPGIGTNIMNPIYQQLREDLLHTETEIDSSKAKVATLSSNIKKSEAELRNIPEDKKMLANLDRDRNTYEGIYEQLLARLGKAEVSEQMELQDKGTTFRIVDPAILPTRPVSPDRVLLIMLGIFAGAGAGLGAVLLREHLDSSIRDIDTLKTQLEMQVLAVIPRIVTEQDIEKRRRLDRRVYAFSAVYLLVIGGVFIEALIKKFL